MRYRSGRNYRPWGLGDGIVSKEISAEWPQIEKCREQKWEYSIETIRRGIVTSRNCAGPCRTARHQKIFRRFFSLTDVEPVRREA